MARLVDYLPKGRTDQRKVGTHNNEGISGKTGSRKPTDACVLHLHGRHSTEDCRDFKPMSTQEKYNALKKEKRCFKCFKAHNHSKCTAKPCSRCGKNHHQLLCYTPERKADEKKEEKKIRDTRETTTNVVNQGTMALYPICKAKLAKSWKSAIIFFDGGSNASYVTSHFARRHHLKQVEEVTLNVTTIG